MSERIFAWLLKLYPRRFREIWCVCPADFRIYRRHGNKVIPVRMPD